MAENADNMLAGFMAIILHHFVDDATLGLSRRGFLPTAYVWGQRSVSWTRVCCGDIDLLCEATIKQSSPHFYPESSLGAPYFDAIRAMSETEKKAFSAILVLPRVEKVCRMRPYASTLTKSGSSSRPRTPAFHAGNTGSNPVPDAEKLLLHGSSFFCPSRGRRGPISRRMKR